MGITPKILCIDDDADDRDLLSQTIKNIQPSISIVEAESGLEGINFLKSVKNSRDLPCLIVLDINMPIMDGKETLQELKLDDDFQHLPVIIFSSSSNPNDKAFFENLGVEMITKPFETKDLQKIARHFLEICK